MPRYSMTIPDLSQLIDNKAILSLLSAIIGGFIGNLIAVLRARVKTLEYSVTHDRVAVSADDAIFGSIRVTWQNVNVTSLYSSRVTLENPTGSNFTNLKIKVFTTDTLLLGERTEISGTSYSLRWTDDLQEQLRVAAGETPTQEQFRIYNHLREYTIPVLNRAQRVLMTYLTVPTGSQSPIISLDLLHEGVRVQHRAVVPHVHGVPVRVAVASGLVTCIAVLVLSSLFLAEPWAAATVCLATGLFAQSIGAFLYRGFRLIKSVVLR